MKPWLYNKNKTLMVPSLKEKDECFQMYTGANLHKIEHFKNFFHFLHTRVA